MRTCIFRHALLGASISDVPTERGKGSKNTPSNGTDKQYIHFADKSEYPKFFVDVIYESSLNK